MKTPLPPSLEQLEAQREEAVLRAKARIHRYENPLVAVQIFDEDLVPVDRLIEARLDELTQSGDRFEAEGWRLHLRGAPSHASVWRISLGSAAFRASMEHSGYPF